MMLRPRDKNNLDIKSIQIFKNIKDENIPKIQSAISFHTYRKKQIIYSQGHNSWGVYCVHSGRVKIYQTTNEGKQYIMNIYNVGDVLGLSSLFNNIYSSTAEMMEEGCLSFIPTKMINELFQQDVQFAETMVQELTNMLNVSENERVFLAEGIVRERMARLLAVLSSSYGVKTQQGIKLNIHLTREELAGLIGTASETAMRLLKEFRDDRILEFKGKEIIIRDVSLLERIADIV